MNNQINYRGDKTKAFDILRENAVHDLIEKIKIHKKDVFLFLKFLKNLKKTCLEYVFKWNKS